MSDSTPHDASNTDRNLLFGVLALQADAIDQSQFAEACGIWATRKQVALGDVLVERGWLSDDERGHIDFLLQRKLAKHSGDAHASLAEVASDSDREVLSSIGDCDVQQSLAGLATAIQRGTTIPVTIGYVPEQAGRYTMTRVHATGGIGRVWLAYDSDLGREVALKELRAEGAGSTALASRFLEEARITGQLEHPGIVPIYELCRRPDDGRPFYTMRFIRGRTLREAIKKYHEQEASGTAAHLDFQALVQAFVGVCNAVAYAHARGVIHRDLKGQNVILGDFGEVIVLDWGLAKLVDRRADEAEATAPVLADSHGSHDATVQGQVIGTPAYMAPEQAAGRLDLIDRRTDVYGLGAVLYEILTAQAPFHGAATNEVLKKVREEEPARPRSLDASAPAALEAVCLKAMAKRRELRYASAGELARDVQRWLADEPVAAFAEPLTVRAGRWARRHKAMVAAAGVLAAAAIAFLLVLTVIAEQARLQSEKEQAATEAARAEAVVNFNTATEQRRRAHAHFQQACDAVDAMLSHVGSNDLADVPHMEKVRERLLGRALAFQEEFLKEKSDDPAVRLETARVHLRVATLSEKLDKRTEAEQNVAKAIGLLEGLVSANEGDALSRHHLAHAHDLHGGILLGALRLHDAEKAHGAALAGYDRLLEDRPGDADYRLNQAAAQSHLSEVLALAGRCKDAEKLQRQACDTFTEVAADRPPDAPVHAALCIARGRLAGLLARLQRIADADREFRATLEVAEALAKTDPESRLHRHQLSALHNNYAMLLADAGRLSEADEHYGQCLATLDRIARDFPDFPLYQRDLINSQIKRAAVLGHLGRTHDATDALARAQQLADALVKKYPQTAHYRMFLSTTHHNRGNLLQQSGRPVEAVPAYQQAITLLDQLVHDNPEVPEYRRDLANSRIALAGSQAQSGRPKEALDNYQKARAALEKLTADHPEVPDYQLTLARSDNDLGSALLRLARFAEGNAAQEKAQTLLEKLVRDHPDVPTYRYEVSAIHNNHATTLDLLGRHRDAEPGYRSAADLLAKLIADFPDLPHYQRDRVNSLTRLANVLGYTGRHAEADRTYREAADAARKLIGRFAANAEYRYLLSGNRHNHATLLAQVGTAEVRDIELAYREALELLGKLTADDPAVPEYRRDQASSRLALAGLLRKSGRASQAMTLARQAVDGLKALVQDYPDMTDYQAVLLQGATQLADMSSEIGPAAVVEKAYLDALAAGQKLAAKHPQQWMFRYQVSAISNNVGNLVRNDGRPKEAEVHYRRGIAELERLVKEQALVPHFRRDLANTLRALGETLAELDRQEEAVKSFERSLELWSKLYEAHPKVTDYRIGKTIVSVEVLLRQGKHEQASKAADELAGIPPDYATNLYNAACLLARCVSVVAKDKNLPQEKCQELMKGYGDRAMARLTESMAKGFSSMELLRTDPDLRPLRDREDFKRLLKKK
jgi:serine/threonine-protein kinase